MKKLSLFIAITAVTMHMFAQKNVGIGNSSPVTKLDISGALSLREGAALSLSNGGSRGGANDNITLPEITGTTDIASFYRITGPTALFSIFGITPNTGADGQVVTLVNTTAYTLTIINNNSSGTGSSIITQTGANILDNAGSSITLQYNKSAGAWYVTATQNYAVTNIQGNPVSNAAPSTNNVLQWNGSSWVPAAASGVTGATGATGSNGAAGPVGATGVDGPTGASGATGNTGPGYLATSASSLTIGSGSQTFTTQSGLAYLPNDEIRISHSATNYMEGTVNFYSATTMIANITNAVGSGTFSSWNIGIAGISGVSGVPGISGVAGVSGVPGATGADGASGVPGAQGVSGIPGVQGISGVSGTPGATGAQGPSGVSGIQGIQGPTGASGISGATGAQGPSGVSGIQGIQGPTGASGISGATGAQGPSGVSGVQGIQGPTGASGISGVTGAQGPSGVSGIQGIQGPTGASGISGATGATGPSGPSGASGVAGTTITVTASNGLTSSGGSSPNITLGGNLTQNTTVTLATGGTNYNMIFNTNSTTNSTGVANYTGGNMVLGTGDGGTPFGGVLRGPNAGNSNTTGGNLVLDAGWATGTAAGGSVFVNGGTTGTGSNGNVYLRGGYSNSLEGAVYLNDDHNGSTFLNDNGGTVTVGSGIAGAQTVTINNASGLYSNTESQSSGLAILTGTNSSGTQGTSDYILYMGADKTNDLGYIQAVKYGLATTQLALNARGGNVGIGTATPQAPLEVSNVGTDVMKVTSTAGGVGNHAYIDFETFAGNYLNARIGAVDMGSNNGSLVFETGNQGTTSTTTTERMRVLNTGAVAFNGATNYGTIGNQLFSNGNAYLGCPQPGRRLKLCFGHIAGGQWWYGFFFPGMGGPYYCSNSRRCKDMVEQCQFRGHHYHEWHVSKYQPGR